MKIKDVELKDTRNLLVKAVEFKNNQTGYEPPITLGKPKQKDATMAMDSAIRNVLHGFTTDLMYAGAPKFLGYAMLSNISQEALIRAGVDTVADECIRKFYKLRYVDEKGGDHEDLINEINEEADRLHLKKIFNKAFKLTGYYGGCLGYIDVGDIDDEEKKEPLILDKKTIKKGMIKGIKLIEPINIYPAFYNTTDPTADDYFVPQSWYILGKEYHASRFLYFCKNEAPLLLKPAYNFFGIPDAQLVLDYVAHFVENRESAQELLHKFSLTCFATDMSQQLQGQSFNDLKSRIGVLNKFRNNNGTFVYNKDTEEISQLNTPLGGVREIVDMSLNLLCAIFRIPKIRLLGEGEGGLNASSVEQTRTFYDYINATKEVMARNPLTDAIKLCQLNLGYEPDENIKIDFPSLWEMDDKEKAELNKIKAERDIAYLNSGVLSQEEVRQSLSLDNDSGYDMIDVEDLPENFEQNMETERFEFEKEQSNKQEETTNDEIKQSMLEKIRSFFHKGLDSTQQKEFVGDDIIDFYGRRHSEKNGEYIKEWGNRYIEYSNKPKEAIEFLLKEKNGYVPNAIYKNGIGYIDFVWGVAGRKNTEEGYGLSHIIRRRKENGYDGEKFIRHIPAIIENGTIAKEQPYKDRIYINTKDKSAVLRLDWDGKENVWLVSAFFKKEDKKG